MNKQHVHLGIVLAGLALSGCVSPVGQTGSVICTWNGVTPENTTRGLTIVVATHDLNFAATLCTSVVMLSAGRVVAAGPTDDTITALSIQALYGVVADPETINGDIAENGIVEIAGPERAPFNEIVARYLKAVGDPREVVSDPEARYFGGRVEEHSLVPLGEARLGRIGFDEWLRRRSQAAA